MSWHCSRRLKGWHAISSFLEQPISVVERWAREGMPVMREGRFVYADPAALQRWLGFQPGTKAETQIVANTSDLGRELRRSLSTLRQQKSNRHSGRDKS